MLHECNPNIIVIESFVYPMLFKFVYINKYINVGKWFIKYFKSHVERRNRRVLPDIHVECQGSLSNQNNLEKEGPCWRTHIY